MRVFNPMTQIYELLTRAKQKTTLGKRRGFSPILAVLILIGITVVAAGQLTGTFNDLTGTASQTANIDIIDPQLRVLGDETYLTLSIKNTGTEAGTIDHVVILHGTVSPNPDTTIITDYIASAGSYSWKETPSLEIGTRITDNLAPGDTVSVKGKVIDTTTGATALKLEKGVDYLIEVTADIDGNDVVKSFGVRAR